MSRNMEAQINALVQVMYVNVYRKNFMIFYKYLNKIVSFDMKKIMIQKH